MYLIDLKAVKASKLILEQYLTLHHCLFLTLYPTSLYKTLLAVQLQHKAHEQETGKVTMRVNVFSDSKCISQATTALRQPHFPFS